jgi:hypothetical protein
MVPQHPSPLDRPRRGFSNQVAAVGPDDQVGFGEPVEAPAHPRARGAIVEDHEHGKEASVPAHDTAGTANIGDRLLHTRTRKTALERIPPRQ